MDGSWSAGMETRASGLPWNFVWVCLVFVNLSGQLSGSLVCGFSVLFCYVLMKKGKKEKRCCRFRATFLRSFALRWQDVLQEVLKCAHTIRSESSSTQVAVLLFCLKASFLVLERQKPPPRVQHVGDIFPWYSTVASVLFLSGEHIQNARAPKAHARSTLTADATTASIR